MPTLRKSVPRFQTVCRKWHRTANLGLRTEGRGCHLRLGRHIVTVMTALTCVSHILGGSAMVGLATA
jgi:hypothetical protein